MPRSTSQTNAIRLTAGLLIAFALAFFFYYGLNTINDPVFSIDFLPYHMAGRLLAAGNLTPLTDYARTGSFGATSGPFLDYFHRYFFPDSPSATHWIYLPGYAWIFRPLAGLEFPLASRVWLAINAILSLGSIALLWSARPQPADRDLATWRIAWIVFFGLTFQPILDNMWHGNISALIFFVFCLSYWLLRRNHPWLAGLALGFIVLLKFYPAFFLLYFAWRRNWRLIAGAVVSCAAMLAVSVLTVGWAGNLAYFQMVLAELRSGGIPAFNNQSIAGFLLHAFTQGDVNAWGEIGTPLSLTLLRLALAGALIVLIAWAMRRRPEATFDPLAARRPRPGAGDRRDAARVADHLVSLLRLAALPTIDLVRCAADVAEGPHPADRPAGDRVRTRRRPGHRGDPPLRRAGHPGCMVAARAPFAGFLRCGRADVYAVASAARDRSRGMRTRTAFSRLKEG